MLDVAQLITEEQAKHKKASRAIPDEAIDTMQRTLINKGYLISVCPSAHRSLAEYLIRAKAGDPRGLCLAGQCGLGKTKFLSEYIDCRMLTSGEIVKRYMADGYTEGFGEWVHGTYHSGLCHVQAQDVSIDELGWEKTAKRYGETLDVLADIIGERYNHWRNHGAKTHLTTNLTAKELDQRYGRRITDRIREMCFIVKFDGKSARGIFSDVPGI